MTNTHALWLAAALVGVIAVAGLALAVLRPRPGRPTLGVRTAWLVAAATIVTTLIFIAVRVIDLIPNATVVDVGALEVAGGLTGVFLALGLKPSPNNGVS